MAGVPKINKSITEAKCDSVTIIHHSTTSYYEFKFGEGEDAPDTLWLNYTEMDHLIKAISLLTEQK